MIVVVAGVAGSGKTTVGRMLAERLEWAFADGDTFHTPANIAKMKSGVALTDEERGPWLAAVGGWMDDCIASGQAAVLACSALKRAYREALLSGRDQVSMVFLVISMEQGSARLMARKSHFFLEPMLASQFADLEPPDAAEPRVHPVPSEGTADQTTDRVIEMLGLARG